MAKQLSKTPTSIKDARDRIERLQRFRNSKNKSQTDIANERITELQQWIDSHKPTLF